MFHVVLFQPEIPPNTGNIIRLCANTGSRLHLIEPIGFSINDRTLRRAGLDYADAVTISRHASMDAFLENVSPQRAFMFSTKHGQRHSDCTFQSGDALVFGPETRGLPDNVRLRVPEAMRLTYSGSVPQHPPTILMPALYIRRAKTPKFSAVAR